jgi:hypothetical protein
MKDDVEVGTTMVAGWWSEVRAVVAQARPALPPEEQ